MTTEKTHQRTASPTGVALSGGDFRRLFDGPVDVPHYATHSRRQARALLADLREALAVPTPAPAAGLREDPPAVAAVRGPAADVDAVAAPGALRGPAADATAVRRVVRGARRTVTVRASARRSCGAPIPAAAVAPSSAASRRQSLADDAAPLLERRPGVAVPVASRGGRAAPDDASPGVARPATLPFPRAESLPCLVPSGEDSSGEERCHVSPDSLAAAPRAAPHVASCHGLAALVDADGDPQGSARRASALPPHVGLKKVLVTGGAGFVGSSTAARLLERGDAVVIVDEMNDYYDVRLKEDNLRRLRELCPDEERLVIYRGDICDEDFMRGLFENERPQWVCHMAARAGVRPSIQDPYVYIHSNIRGTTHLMELCHRFGVKNFVFASSSSVYGGSKNALFSEDDCVDNPVSPYAAVSQTECIAWHVYIHQIECGEISPNGSSRVSPLTLSLHPVIVLVEESL